MPQKIKQYPAINKMETFFFYFAYAVTPSVYTSK